MNRALLFALFLASTASAQLTVTKPDEPPCKPNSTPVLGIYVHYVLGGSFGYDFTNLLTTGLTAKGFQVLDEYEPELMDKVSVGVRGDVNYWQNFRGETSTRVGKAHIEIYDLSTSKILFNLDQKPAGIVLNAPKDQDFVNQVVKFISDNFCQQ